ncbi:MAG: DUF1587 domain-containing protein, partial [Lentisphaeraceae bacterium]|nr:DUF1587 domain-containing protein [Lentisphaeraceae bacterium]
MSQKKKFRVSADHDKRILVKKKKNRPFLKLLIITSLIFFSYLYLGSNSPEVNQASVNIPPNPKDNGSELSSSLDLTPHKLTEFHREVIGKYCIDCHDSVSEEGGVNLEDLSLDVGKDIQTAEMWSHILNAVNSGEMPPKKKKQLPKDVKMDFLKDLSKAMVLARRKLSDRSGEVTMRRLNRREYVNSLTNLLGFEPRKDTYLVLPKDEDLGGFDTNGNSLYFSSH